MTSNSSVHRHHDLDLVDALAEDRLPHPAQAEAQVASCTECAAAYAAYRAVIAAVRADPSPALADGERRRLHQAVWDEVQGSVAPLSAAKNPWWYRAAPVAAVLAVVVAIGALIVRPGGDSADVEPLSMTFAADSRTEAAADSAPAGSPDANLTSPMAAGQDALTEEVALFRESLREEREEAVQNDTTAATEGDEAADCVSAAADPALLHIEGRLVEGRRYWFAAFGEPDQFDVTVYDGESCSVVYAEG